MKERIKYGIGSNIFEVDTHGGYNYFSAWTAVPVMRIVFIYLRPGIYTFNVGVRTVYSRGEFFRGIMTLEATQFVDRGLTSIGDYNLADVPTKNAAFNAVL